MPQTEVLDRSLALLNKKDELEGLTTAIPGSTVDFSAELSDLAEEMDYLGEELAVSFDNDRKEAGRRLLANSGEIRMSSPPTPGQFYRLFGITTQDRVFLEQKLRATKSEAQGARRSLADFYRRDPYFPLSLQVPHVANRARRMLMKTVREYAVSANSRLFPEINEDEWRSAPFCTTDDYGSSVDYQLGTIEISLPLTAISQKGKVRVNKPLVLGETVHEGTHWRQFQATKKATTLHPLFQKPDYSVQATQESAAKFFEEQAVELLRSDIKEEQALAWLITLQYTHLFNHLSRMVFLENPTLHTAGGKAEALERLEEFAIVNGAETEALVNHLSQLRNGQPSQNYLQDIKYASSVVPRAVDTLEKNGIPYKSNRVEVNKLLLTGYYTPQGLTTRVQEYIQARSEK